MAPVRRTPVQSTSRKDSHSKSAISVFGSLRLSLRNMHAKISDFRSHRTGNAAKLNAPGQENANQRVHGKRVVKKLSAIEEKKEDEEQYSEEMSNTPSDHDDNSGSTVPPPQNRLTIESFELGGRLGKGKFGKVFLARHVETNYICALKVISKQQCAFKSAENLVRRELETHQNLAHPNILRFHTWMHDAKDIFLVLEYAPNGSLFDLLNKQPDLHFTERETATYVSQMALALQYMHGKNVMHRDIKPENILLGLHNEIKLADFGYSVHSSSGVRSTLCGTRDYMPPEMVVTMLKPDEEPQSYTKAVDQWALGVLTYELLVGVPPFEMQSEEAMKMMMADVKGMIEFPEHVSLAAEEFVLQVSLHSSLY